MRRLIGLMIAAVLVISACPADLATGEPCFQMADPAGDDYGPGSYIYPKNVAFEPYHGLFDLLDVTVSVAAETIHFDLTIAELRNPWAAPEGFSHQVIEIYIHRGVTPGRTETFRPGAHVAFSPDYPWDAMLKAVPWDESELIVLDESGQAVKGILTVGTAGSQVIRLNVPVAAIGHPQPSWRYYVLVGSYDGFGEDDFRPVMAKPGEWYLGGGRDDAAEPQVIDLLAPNRGRYSQEKQLCGYDPATDTMAVLMPVGPGFIPGIGGFPWWLVPVLVGAGILVLWWLWYAPAGWRERVGEVWRRLRTSSFSSFPHREKEKS